MTTLEFLVYVQGEGQDKSLDDRFQTCGWNVKGDHYALFRRVLFAVFGRHVGIATLHRTPISKRSEMISVAISYLKMDML